MTLKSTSHNSISSPETVPDGGEHEGVGPDCPGRQEVHLEAGGRYGERLVGQQQQQQGHHVHEERLESNAVCCVSDVSIKTTLLFLFDQ